MTVLTAFASPANTIEAMRLGAHDHLTKPIGRSDLAAALDAMLRTGPPDSAGPAVQAGHPGLVGSSASMRRVQKTIGLVADTASTVLIRGETGSRSVDAVPHESRLARVRQRVASTRSIIKRPRLRPATVEARRPVAP